MVLLTLLTGIVLNFAFEVPNYNLSQKNVYAGPDIRYIPPRCLPILDIFMILRTSFIGIVKNVYLKFLMI